MQIRLGKAKVCLEKLGWLFRRPRRLVEGCATAAVGCGQKAESQGQRKFFRPAVLRNRSAATLPKVVRPLLRPGAHQALFVRLTKPRNGHHKADTGLPGGGRFAISKYTKAVKFIRNYGCLCSPNNGHADLI